MTGYPTTPLKIRAVTGNLTFQDIFRERGRGENRAGFKKSCSEGRREHATTAVQCFLESLGLSPTISTSNKSLILISCFSSSSFWTGGIATTMCVWAKWWWPRNSKEQELETIFHRNSSRTWRKSNFNNLRCNSGNWFWINASLRKLRFGRNGIVSFAK